MRKETEQIVVNAAGLALYSGAKLDNSAVRSAYVEWEVKSYANSDTWHMAALNAHVRTIMDVQRELHTLGFKVL